MQYIAVVLVLLAWSTEARAQYFGKDQLGKVIEVQVVIDGEVKDDCLPQPASLKTEAELVMRRSGIKVVDKETLESHTLEVNFTGRQLAEGATCLAYLRLEIWRFEDIDDGTTGLVLASTDAVLLTGPKAGFQLQLREQVNGKATALANEILKARGR